MILQQGFTQTYFLQPLSKQTTTSLGQLNYIKERISVLKVNRLANSPSSQIIFICLFLSPRLFFEETPIHKMKIISGYFLHGGLSSFLKQDISLPFTSKCLENKIYYCFKRTIGMFQPQLGTGVLYKKRARKQVKLSFYANIKLDFLLYTSTIFLVSNTQIMTCIFQHLIKNKCLILEYYKNYGNIEFNANLLNIMIKTH